MRDFNYSAIKGNKNGIQKSWGWLLRFIKKLENRNYI